MAVAATGALRPLPVDDAVRESEWMPLAACIGADLALFFPVGTSGPALVQAAEAKRICRSCPVRRACDEWATRTGQVGIWGGFDESERAERRRASRERVAS